MEFKTTWTTGAGVGTGYHKYNFNFDITEPVEHLGHMFAEVGNFALSNLAKGAGGLLVASLAGPEATAAAAVKLMATTGGVAAIGVVQSLAIEIHDLYSNKHDIPVTAWVSSRDAGGLKFVGIQKNNDGSSTSNYTMGGVKVASSDDGFDFTGNKLANAIIGTDWNNDMHGGAGGDKMWGRKGNDAMWGDDGNDTLNGGKGYDKLNGGAGNDWLDGGGHDAARDVMMGGLGADTLVFYDKRGGGDRGVFTNIEDHVRGFGDIVTIKRDAYHFMEYVDDEYGNRVVFEDDILVNGTAAQAIGVVHDLFA